jgi:hypothetical protein
VLEICRKAAGASGAADLGSRRRRSRSRFAALCLGSVTDLCYLAIQRRWRASHSGLPTQRARGPDPSASRVAGGVVSEDQHLATRTAQAAGFVDYSERSRWDVDPPSPVKPTSSYGHAVGRTVRSLQLIHQLLQAHELAYVSPC